VDQERNWSGGDWAPHGQDDGHFGEPAETARGLRKYLTARKTYVAHDPRNLCQVGDKVRIIESRPSANQTVAGSGRLEKGRAETALPEAIEGVESQS